MKYILVFLLSMACHSATMASAGGGGFGGGLNSGGGGSNSGGGGSDSGGGGSDLGGSDASSDGGGGNGGGGKGGGGSEGPDGSKESKGSRGRSSSPISSDDSDSSDDSTSSSSSSRSNLSKVARYIRANFSALEKEIAVGEGAHLDGLLDVAQCEQDVRQKVLNSQRTNYLAYTKTDTYAERTQNQNGKQFYMIYKSIVQRFYTGQCQT